MLDGVDTSSVDLQRLRSAITCIPQDPTIFSGDIRYNLDPFGLHSDDRLWWALEAAQLKHLVVGLPNGLRAEIAEFGDNLSEGQKQLLCLARALLRDAKLACLDEATASVDLHTDELIQSAIGSHFSNCTVLTVAHRVHTVIESDRVLCLDRGKVQEFDHPHNLLANSSSLLSGLVDELGSEAASSLREKAKRHYFS